MNDHHIPIRFCGYRTRSGKIERSAMLYVQEYLEVLVGKHIDKIKEIRLVGYKHPIESWRWGYHWLHRNGIITIVLPPGWRGWFRSKWLIAHELAHTKQLLSGIVEARHGLSHVRYKDQWYSSKTWTDRKTGKESSRWTDPAGRMIRQTNLPWEKAANEATDRVCKGYYYKD